MISNNKYGIGIGLGYKESFEEQVKTVARVGFDACFTGWSDECDMEAFANTISKNGLIYQSVHAPFIGVHEMWNAGSAGEKYTDMLIRCIEDCKRYDVKIMVAHVIIGMDRHFPSTLGITRFSRLLEAAEKHGVTVAFENTEGLEYLEAVMADLGHSDSCGFCWDTGHEQCYNYGQDMMARFGNKLVATHINDNLGMTDVNDMTWLDDAHLMPFDGITDWKSVIDRLDKAGYNGIYTMELTLNSKPGKNTHDIYKELSLEQFLSLALEKAKKITSLRSK